MSAYRVAENRQFNVAGTVYPGGSPVDLDDAAAAPWLAAGVVVAEPKPTRKTRAPATPS